MSKEEQFNQQAEITTTNYLTKLMQQIEEHIQKQSTIDTGFIDEDLPSRKSRLGCGREGCREGYIQKEDGTLDYCVCYKIEKMRVRLLKAGIPEDYHHIQKIDEEKLRVMQKMYADDTNALREININKMLNNFKNNIHKIKNEGWNLIFEGPTGSGKTTAACICAKHALISGYSALFMELQELRKLWIGDKFNSEETEERKQKIYTVDFLVLDDLGQEFVSDKSDYQITELDLLLRQRTNNKLCTIFTTNARFEDISSRYGERIASLLKKRMVHVIMHREVDIRENNQNADFLFS